jgi:hypothetical protein
MLEAFKKSDRPEYTNLVTFFDTSRFWPESAARIDDILSILNYINKNNTKYSQKTKECINRLYARMMGLSLNRPADMQLDEEAIYLNRFEKLLIVYRPVIEGGKLPEHQKINEVIALISKWVFRMEGSQLDFDWKTPDQRSSAGKILKDLQQLKLILEENYLESQTSSIEDTLNDFEAWLSNDLYPALRNDDRIYIGRFYQCAKIYLPAIKYYLSESDVVIAKELATKLQTTINETVKMFSKDSNFRE